MGCFNEACALSGLPITNGMAVKQLFLFENTERERSHRTCSVYSPLTIPLNGKYDNYGNIKYKETDPIALFNSRILNKLSNKAGTKCIERGIDASMRGELTVSKLKCYSVFFRSDVWNKYLETAKTIDYMKNAEEELLEIKDTLKSRDVKEEYLSICVGLIAVKFIGHNELDSIENQFIDDFKKECCTSKDLDLIFNQLVDFVKIMMLMDALRQSFSLPSLGGQEGGYKLHKQVKSAILAICR